MATEAPPSSCCSNPGCDQPGTSQCGACKNKPYCGSICQTADWPQHKDECEGHLHKIGKAHLDKAACWFFEAHNRVQSLRYSDLALAKLNAMKKRPLEDISEALVIKCAALQDLDRHLEALQCAKDKYNLWAMARGPAHPFTIDAAFYLIECLLSNKEYEDAHLFAYTLWEIIHNNNHVDNDIPADKRQKYVATAASLLAKAILHLARSGGIPPEEKEKAGEEAIARARQSVEIHIQMCGAESEHVANPLVGLADVLDYFNDGIHDGEVFRLYEQAIAISTRAEGITSANVGTFEFNLGAAYGRRANSALAVDDLDRYVANLELALPHFRETARILSALNRMDRANIALHNVADFEGRLLQARSGMAEVEAAAARV